MRIEKLSSVCNGVHFWNLNKEGQLYIPSCSDMASFSEKELILAMLNIRETKAILIVDRVKQKKIEEELTNLHVHLEKYREDLVGHVIVARKLARWSATADLWMVKWLWPRQTWETST